MNLFDFILFCCNKLWEASKWLVTMFLQLVRFGLHYCWIVVPFTILGLVAGWLWAKPFATLYKGAATIVYAEGMRDVVQKGITDFFNLPNDVKSELGIHPDLLERLLRVEVYNIVDCNTDSVVDFVDWNRKISMSDTTDWIMRDRLHLVVKLQGTDECKPFQVALSKFFNSSEYALVAHENCKKIQEERLAFFTKELSRLDSFSTYAYFERPKVSNVELINVDTHYSSNKDLYYRDMMEVLKHKNYLEMQAMSTPEVINFQTPFVVYAFSPIYKYMVGLLVGFIAGLCVALLVKYRKEVMLYLKEK